MRVFTNGIFDILHAQHIRLLEYCRELAGADGVVIVGINSDESVRRLKGPTRPINNQQDREAMLRALRFVDEVIVFEENTPYELIDDLRPDIIVKGGDYKPENVVHGSYPTKVAIFPYVDGYSTTKIIKRIKG